MRALIVEDDPRYGAHLQRLLTREGFVVDWESDGDEALERGYEAGYAVILLDLMLTGEGGRAVDGLSLLRRWRKKGVGTPVLVLTASRTDIEDTTMSYEWDADYEVKRPGEEFDALLLAWARSRAARGAKNGGATSAGARVTSHGPVSVDHELREVRLDGKPVDLSQTEFNVLAQLLKNADQWLSVDQIAQAAFGPNCETPQAQVYEYVKRLRQKLGFSAIRNKRGSGYRYVLSDMTQSDGNADAP